MLCRGLEISADTIATESGAMANSFIIGHPGFLRHDVAFVYKNV